MQSISRSLADIVLSRQVLLFFSLLGSPLWALQSELPSTEFAANYFDNPDLVGEPILNRRETQLIFDWGYDSPDVSLPRNGFSARWRGTPFFSAGRYRFEVVADDGVRLWINGNLILDEWQPQARTTFRPEFDFVEGNHLIELEYFEKSGQAVLECSWTKLTETPGAPPQNQFRADYFDNRHLQGTPILSRLEPAIDHHWSHDAPAAGLPNNDFSVRWRGRFTFKEGTYSFVAKADDGVRLWIDGHLVIDAWRDQAESRHEGQLELEAGEHLVTLEYYEHGGEASAQLFWYPQSPAANSTSPMGINLSALSYYSTEWTLIDAMKSAGGWYTHADGAWDTHEHLDLDPQGWVRSLPRADDETTRYRRVGALMLNGTNGHYPAGRYTVLYDGEGSMTFSGDAKHLHELDEPGRLTLEVAKPSNAGIHLVITDINPQDYLRNIRVILPGHLCGGDPFQLCTPATCADSSCPSLADQYQHFPFHPLFLKRLRPFKVLRFMDFLRTNTTQVSDWSQRPLPGDTRWNSRNGAPLETAISLANQLNADAWLNVPVRANDHYVRRMAQLVRRQLGPHQRVYVEYGNEIWNTAFRAGEWVQEQGLATWPNDEASPFTKRIRWYAKRAAEIGAIWRAEWQTEPKRLSMVLGAHAANPWVANQALSWLAATTPSAEQASVFDALAIAPYFGGAMGKADFLDQLRTWQMSDDPLHHLFQALRSDTFPSGIPTTADWVEAHSTIAKNYGLNLLAYEGGQHLVGVGTAMEDLAASQLFQQANRDPRIADLYTSYLNQWRAAGGQLFCHFLNVGPYSKFGSWGTWEYQDQQTSPKAEAILSFIQENPCWWHDPISPPTP